MSKFQILQFGLHERARWWNDLILDGKKVGGILTEMVAGGANHHRNRAELVKSNDR